MPSKSGLLPLGVGWLGHLARFALTGLAVRPAPELEESRARRSLAVEPTRLNGPPRLDDELRGKKVVVRLRQWLHHPVGDNHFRAID